MDKAALDYHEKIDAVMSFIDRYAEDIANAPDDSLLAVFGILVNIGAGSVPSKVVHRLVDSLYIIANIYNDQRLKEENDDKD